MLKKEMLQACVFPFLWQYDNVVYTGCAFDKSRDILPWCSTKVSIVRAGRQWKGKMMECKTVRQRVEFTRQVRGSGATAVTTVQVGHSS